MNLSRFEQLVLVIGAIAVLGSLASAIPSGSAPETIEVAAQVLLMGVLFAAVRYGRRGGLIAAIMAMVIYVVARIPVLTSGPVTLQVALMVGSRLIAFGALGIVGGELCARLRYTLARLEDGSPIDETSRVFNQRYASRAIEQALGRYRRYSEPFSLILITLSDSIFADTRPVRQRALLRGVATHIRNDIRMVDEVARLDDGRFLAILPHTPLAGAEVVATRLATLVVQSLGAAKDSVQVSALSVPEHETGISSLLNEMGGENPAEPPAAQVASE